MKTLIAFIGISGSGKSTLEKKMVLTYPEFFDRIVSCTTREPRKGEQEGYDYFFLKEEDFLKTNKIENQKWLNTYYGIQCSELDKFKKVDNLIVTVMPSGFKEVISYIKNNKLDIKTKIILFDINKETAINNMYKRLADDTNRKREDLTINELDNISNRVKKDNIINDFKNSGLKADFIFHNLGENMEKDLFNFIYNKK